jgi:uncharacterized protein
MEVSHNKAGYLGIITQGSLSTGLEMRLEPTSSVEDLRVGRFVVVEGRNTRFFSMLTDVSLSTTNPRILFHPPHGDDFVLSVLSGVSTFGTVKVQPMLMLDKQRTPEEGRELSPVKTIPSHFSPVYEATHDDFALVFGQEDEHDSGNSFFNIGRPLNMETPVCGNPGVRQS